MFFWMALLSCLLAMALTPTAVKIGWKIGALDVPRDWRRMHRVAIPRSGGLAIFLSFLIAISASTEITAFLRSALLGGGLFLLLGLLDDIFCLRAYTKLFLQIPIAVLSVYWSGMIPEGGILFATLWVLMLVNAHNFVDGLDGLLSGTVALEGSALCICFVLLDRLPFALPPLLLAAACLGFRHFNRFPARIFAGDCGSQSVGFFMGYLSLPLLYALPREVGALSPLFLFAYPLTDLVTAVSRRLLRGKSPFAADRAHLHHRLCDVGVSHPQCTNILHLICASMETVGVLLCNGAFLLPAGIACLLSAVLLIYLRRTVAKSAASY